VDETDRIAEQDSRDSDVSEIDHEDIDGSFVPVAVRDVATVELDGEMVLARIPAGMSHLQTFALNQTASIVWQCFDGSGTLDEIVTDVADAFGADVDVVSADVLALARELGAAGLLVGVREHVPEVMYEPQGVAAGLPLPSFEAVDERGQSFSSEQLHGRRTLLVTWSATCGYCERIGDDLCEVAPALASAGVDLVLLALGGREANRALLDRIGLDCRLLLQEPQIAEAFRGIGTPAAYLVDEDGNVAEPLALGALEVPELARRLVDENGVA
jgi:peroxiredoxin